MNDVYNVCAAEMENGWTIRMCVCMSVKEFIWKEHQP